jgi:hypothetical protein
MCAPRDSAASRSIARPLARRLINADYATNLRPLAGNATLNGRTVMSLRIVQSSAALLVALALVPTGGAQAQTPGGQEERPQWENVISANPFGILLELFNAEYERVISQSSTVGFGGSYFSDDDDSYLNADLFWRFYMQERPLEGWAFGAKAGLTNVPDSGTYFGFGFDLNRSWLMGQNDNFYIGAGFGLKRLLGADREDFDLRFIPTIRIINVGIAF